MYADLKGACLSCYSTVEDITRNASDTAYTEIYAHIYFIHFCVTDFYTNPLLKFRKPSSFAFTQIKQLQNINSTEADLSREMNSTK